MEPATSKVAAPVEIVLTRIRQFRDGNEIFGEQNTQAALIEPMLPARGWDLQEFDEVHHAI